MTRPSTLATLATFALAVAQLAACHAAPAADVDGASTELPVDRDGGRAHVELSWRLFETQRWLDGRDKHESAVVEFLVNGGTPGRVELGRRDTAGCAIVLAPAGAPAVVTSLVCPHVRADVRLTAGELRVVASDHDPVGPPDASTHERVATVRVPVDAEIDVDPLLTRIPDEAPGF